MFCSRCGAAACAATVQQQHAPQSRVEFVELVDTTRLRTLRIVMGQGLCLCVSLRAGLRNPFDSGSSGTPRFWDAVWGSLTDARFQERQRRADKLLWFLGVVERTFAWLNQFRRLRVRYEKRADIHEAFLSLGCALICWRFLRVDRAAG